MPSHTENTLWQRIRRLPRNIWILTWASFLTDISTDMIVHLIPFFLANVLGVRTVTIGLIEGIAETTASLLKIVSGHISDKLGQRKWLTVAGYGLSTVAKPFLVLANSWQIVLGVKFFERMGKGIRTAPRDALVADSIEPQHRGLAFGLHRAGDTAGAAVGLLIALLVVWIMQGRQLTLGLKTFHTLVWLSVIPAALTAILLAVGIEEKKGAGGGERPSLSFTSFNTNFKRFLIIVGLFTLGNSTDAFLILRAQERGFSILGVMALLAGFNIIYATISGPAGSLSDRLGRRTLIIGGWLFYALVYAGFAFAQTGWHIILLYGAYGIYYGLAHGSAKAYVADLVALDVRGTAYGWYNAAVGLAALPASVLAGLLWQGAGNWAGFGVQAPFLWGAGLAVTAVLLLMVWMPEGAETAV